MIVSPSTLQVRLLGIEQEAKAWHWYRTAVETRDKLNTLQESVDSLFTEVNTVREDIDDVTTELSVEGPKEN